MTAVNEKTCKCLYYDITIDDYQTLMTGWNADKSEPDESELKERLPNQDATVPGINVRPWLDKTGERCFIISYVDTISKKAYLDFHGLEHVGDIVRPKNRIVAQKPEIIYQIDD
jgi:hypothetical protein